MSEDIVIRKQICFALQILLFDETSCSKEVLMQVGVMDCCKFIEELLQIDSLFNEVILSVEEYIPFIRSFRDESFQRE